MNCHEMLRGKEVGLMMGSLCNTCFDQTKTVIWFNELGLIEYCVDVFELVKHVNVDVLDKYKNRCEVLQPEVRDSDLSAHMEKLLKLN